MFESLADLVPNVSEINIFGPYIYLNHLKTYYT